MLGIFKKSTDVSSTSWFDRLKTGLKNTGSRLGNLLVGRKIDETLFDELESALLAGDTGVAASEDLLKKLRQRVLSKHLETAEQLKEELHQILVESLKPLQCSVEFGPARPFVIMLAGVNGAGKTTSIGKIAKMASSKGLSVLLAAGDTFRAAAREQLVVWGERNNIAVVSQQGADAASVIFDAVQSAKARGIDVVIADTAGRLHTQIHLMEELKKIKRVIGKADSTAPHAIWLVLDSNTGQNALAQFKAFDEALGLTGLILTKLDGTAKGGVIAAIAQSQVGMASRRAGVATHHTRPDVIPVVFIGVGEGIDDLQPFDASEFVSALLDRS
ncbi:MAG: signal recognition particle-docking protein FtsY [Burkholderiales bacterium]